MLPAGEGGHGIAVHQGGNVAAHAVVPGAAVGVEFGGVGDRVAAGAQIAGHCAEGGKVEAGQAGHGAAQVNPFHGESLPGHAQAVEWGSYAASVVVDREQGECCCCHSRNLSIAKGFNSVQPEGHPISHSTHSGFSGPPTT